MTIEIALTAASDHSSVMLASGQYCLTPRMNRSPSRHSMIQNIERKTDNGKEKRCNARLEVTRLFTGSNRNLAVVYLDVTNSKTHFSPSKPHRG